MTLPTELKPDPSGPPVAASSPQRPVRHLPRRIITWVLIVLFAVLTPLTISAAWAVRTVTDTNRYVETLQPLASDPVITNYIADRATTTLFDQLNVQKRIANALPVGGSIIAAPLTAQLQTFTDQQIRKLLDSTWFQELWKKENTFTHSTAVSILTGNEPPPVSTARNLVLNLTPALTNAIDELDKKGITVFDPIKKKLKNDQVLVLQLMSNKQVKSAQTFFRLSIDMRQALLIVTPLLGVAAILVAVERRRAALRLLLGGIIGCLLLIILLTIVRAEFVNLAQPGGQLPAQHLWDALTRFLRETILWVIGIFTVAALILWLVGPSTWAVGLRRGVRGSGKKISESAGDAYRSETTAKAVAKVSDGLERGSAFVKRYQAAFRWAGVAVAALFLLFSVRTGGGILWTLILLGLYQLIISIPWVRRRPGLEAGAPSGEAPVTPAQLAASEPTSGVDASGEDQRS